MPDGILPALLLILLEVWELGGDVSVNLRQGGPLVGTVLYGHGDQSHVGVRRFRILVILIGTRR